jgi:hypothetical protein
VATPQQRRPGDLSRAGAFEDLRSQPRQNPSKAQRDLRAPSRHVCSVIGEARRADPGRDQSFRAGQFLQHARPRPKPCSTQVRSTQIGVVEFRFLELDLIQAGTGEVRLPQRSVAEISPPEGGAAQQGVVERLHRRRSAPLKSARRRSALQNARSERRVPASSARAPAAPPLSTQVTCSLRMAAKAHPDLDLLGRGPSCEVILY